MKVDNDPIPSQADQPSRGPSPYLGLTAHVEMGREATILKWAAVYNVAWGSFVILFPHGFFDALSMPRPNYPEIWQCVGMIVGVYGIGYWLAARNPLVHWPVVLVGFLGKIFGPLGFLSALIQGTLPLKFGLLLVTNDLIWWIPFFLILKKSWLWHQTLKEIGRAHV